MQTIPWNREFEIENGHYRLFKVGELNCVIAKRGGEWHVAHFKSRQLDLKEEGYLDDISWPLEWKRWEASLRDSMCMINPVLPEYRVISKPTVPVTLAPGTKACFYMGVPASVAMVAKCNDTYIVLDTTPTEDLSYTWKDSPVPGKVINTTQGEVCMALPTHARGVYRPEIFSSTSIICTVVISNHCRKPIPFTRFQLNVNRLGLFMGDTHVWSNVSRYDIFDDEFPDGIFYADSPPGLAGDSVPIAPPREREMHHAKSLVGFSSFVDQFKLKI